MTGLLWSAARPTTRRAGQLELVRTARALQVQELLVAPGPKRRLPPHTKRSNAATATPCPASISCRTDSKRRALPTRIRCSARRRRLRPLAPVMAVPAGAHHRDTRRPVPRSSALAPRRLPRRRDEGPRRRPPPDHLAPRKPLASLRISINHSVRVLREFPGPSRGLEGEADIPSPAEGITTRGRYRLDLPHLPNSAITPSRPPLTTSSNPS